MLPPAGPSSAKPSGSLASRNDRPGESPERCTQLGISDIGKARIEHCRIAVDRRTHRRSERLRRCRKCRLNEGQASDHRTAEVKVDALDQQRRPMLQFKCCHGTGMQLQHAVAAKSYRPSDERPFRSDNRRPIGLEPYHHATTALGRNRCGEL